MSLWLRTMACTCTPWPMKPEPVNWPGRFCSATVWRE
jgi:hypothetical protein